jgi:hypothetical protein
VAGGRWQVAGGRWQVAGGRWQVRLVAGGASAGSYLVVGKLAPEAYRERGPHPCQVDRTEDRSK